MDSSFSWKNYHRWADTLQSIGFVFLIIGPLVGIVLLVVGDLMLKLMGVIAIAASILICLYHMSFCLLMNAIEQIKDQLTGPGGSEPEATP